MAIPMRQLGEQAAICRNLPLLFILYVIVDYIDSDIIHKCMDPRLGVLSKLSIRRSRADIRMS